MSKKKLRKQVKKLKKQVKELKDSVSKLDYEDNIQIETLNALCNLATDLPEYQNLEQASQGLISKYADYIIPVTQINVYTEETVDEQGRKVVTPVYTTDDLTTKEV